MQKDELIEHIHINSKINNKGTMERSVLLSGQWQFYCNTICFQNNQIQTIECLGSCSCFWRLCLHSYTGIVHRTGVIAVAWGFIFMTSEEILGGWSIWHVTSLGISPNFLLCCGPIMLLQWCRGSYNGWNWPMWYSPGVGGVSYLTQN